jgi:hypothetical protein
MTVAELLGRISGVELAEWDAYFRLEAEDRARSDLDARATARLASMQGSPGSQR